MFKPTAEQALRSNQSAARRRLNTALELMTQPIRNLGDVKRLEEVALVAAERSVLALRELVKSEEHLGVLWKLKCEEIGFSPMNSETPLNFVEQLNQTFTVLATAGALRALLKMHRGVEYTVNLGARSGADIESSPKGLVVAEVFAAVRPGNNSKLKNDIKRVSEYQSAFRYVFYMSRGVPGRTSCELIDGRRVDIYSLGPGA